MEFKGTKEKINELEIQKSYLTDIGLRHLFELKELLKQREEMLEMLKNILLAVENSNIEADVISMEDLEKLINEATKID